jgi:zinc transport system ATP-binding protein
MVEVQVIEIENVSFAYNGVLVLENVSFGVTKGDFLSIVGPNGGGKTTLLKLILGLLLPRSGEIRIFGRPPEKSRERIGYMPQHMHFDPQFPIAATDVVLMGRLGNRFGSRYTKEDKQAVIDALEEVDMTCCLKQSFSNLSVGQRQRVLLARALVSKPEILLLDEPTANVDMEIENKLYDILNSLNERMTILMVTHDLGFVSRIVRSVICVNKRVVVHPTSQINGKLIQEIYEDDLRMVRHDQKQHR